MKISKKIQADLQSPGASSVVYAVQNDSNTREVEIHLFSGGVSWAVPEEAIAAVAFKKQDGKSGLYDKLPNGEQAVYVSGSVVTIILAQEVLTVQGIVSVSVVFYDENLNQIATFPFSVAVAENPSQGEGLSNNYYNFQTIGDINAALDLLNKSSVRIDVIQEFSEEEKQAARNNIGAIGDGDHVTELTADFLGVGWNFPDDPDHPDNHRGAYLRYLGYRPDGTDMVRLIRMKGEGSVSLGGIAPGEEDTDVVNKGQLDKATDSVLYDISYDWAEVKLDKKEWTGYYNKSGKYVEDNSRAYAIVDGVSPNDKYKLNTMVRSANIPAAVYYSGDTFLSYEKAGTGVNEYLNDYVLTIPANCTRMIVQSGDCTKSSVYLYQERTTRTPKFYRREETDGIVEDLTGEIAKNTSNKYGVKWSATDPEDLGQRCFSAEGLTAEIGIGATNGHSDFDSIYPWCDMKRCNIRENENGASIVTYEGEAGFALDGSNGNVFVRIPKFNVHRYTKDGYAYLVIGDSDAPVHEAFVEDGKVLDEIFIGAFEGFVGADGKLCSVAGVIPTSNEAPATFLGSAAANGMNHSLYDNRCVDAVWCLMAVEYGCRNSNSIVGYGLADFMQAIDDPGLRVAESATGSNSVKINKMIPEWKAMMPVGSNITICNTSQTNIVAQRRITGIEDTADGLHTVFTFDGDGVDVDTNCFIGSAALHTNFCETSQGALTWHTGRSNWISGSTTRNPIRYRWIENVVGNLWHYLPDVTFRNCQMYVCKNMRDYEFHKYAAPYAPVGDVLQEQTENGSKADASGKNYWVTSLLNDTFAKAVPFGSAWDKSLTSKKAFGAYFYLWSGTECIANGGGFDHLWRCNILTQRAWIGSGQKWYLYGARLMFKKIS